MSEFFTAFVKLYGGPSALGLLAIVIVAVWVFAHRSTPPGKEVSVFFGLAVYTKGAKATMPDEFRKFADRLVGHWWSIRHWDANSLGFEAFSIDDATRTVKVRGWGYGSEGELISKWESEASCINPTRTKLYYYWTGQHPSRDGRPAGEYKGFCEITFATDKRPDSGDGVFSDTALSNAGNTMYKSFELKRCTEHEAQVMAGRNKALIATLVQSKLQKGA